MSKGKWSKAECARLASQCRNRSEFKTNSRGAYNAALANGWMDKIFSTTRTASTTKTPSKKVSVVKTPTSKGKKTPKPSGYWTKTKCLEVARQCSSRSDLKSKFRSAYNNMLKFGMLDKVFKQK